MEIGVWKEREALLAGADNADETAKEPPSPREESPRPVEPEKEFDEPTHMQVTAEDPSAERVGGSKQEEEDQE